MMRRYGICNVRFFMLLVSIIVAAAVMPLFSYAGSDLDSDIAVRVEKLPEDEVKLAEEKAKEKAFGVDSEKDSETDGEETEVEPCGTDYFVDPEKAKVRLGSRRKGMSLKDSGPSSWSLTVSDPDEDGIITVRGLIGDADYSFYALYIDGYEVDFGGEELNGRREFTAYIDMKEYSVGFHTLTAELNYGDVLSDVILYKQYVPTYIYEEPENAKSWYYTYTKSVSLYYGGDSYDYDGDCDVYMQYKKGKGKWTKDYYGPVSTSSYDKSKRSGFKANTNVSVRLVYGKKFTYNDESYLFTGGPTGCYSDAVSVKTAYAKPKVKSIKISKVKVSVHRWKVRYATRIYYIKQTGRIIRRVPLYHHYKTARTRFRVTVTFKKKQGIAGVYIGAKGLSALKRGNKKKYSATFVVSGNKRGKRTVVSVRSYRSSIYGGYSGTLKKRTKIK